MSALANWKNLLGMRFTQSAIGQGWLQLPTRDRLALLLLGVFFALALFYALIWQPITGKLEHARAQHQQARELYAYLLKNAAQASQLSKTAKVQLAPEQLQGLVTASAQQHGLLLERYDSEGSNGLLIALTQASFEPMLRWIAELEEKGVNLTEVSLDKVGTGKVDAKLTLLAGDEEQ